MLTGDGEGRGGERAAASARLQQVTTSRAPSLRRNTCAGPGHEPPSCAAIHCYTLQSAALAPPCQARMRWAGAVQPACTARYCSEKLQAAAEARRRVRCSSCCSSGHQAVGRLRLPQLRRGAQRTVPSEAPRRQATSCPIESLCSACLPARWASAAAAAAAAAPHHNATLRADVEMCCHSPGAFPQGAPPEGALDPAREGKGPGQKC